MTKAGQRHKKRNSRAQRKKRNLKKAHLSSQTQSATSAAEHVQRVTQTPFLLLPAPDQSGVKNAAGQDLLQKNKKAKESSPTGAEGKRTKRPDSLRKTKPARKSAAARRRRQAKPASGFIHGLRNIIWKTAFVVAAVCLLYVYAASQSLTHFGPDIERLASEHLDIDVELAGDIGLVMPIISPGLYLNDVSVSAQGESDEDKLFFERIEIRFDFSSLFGGEDVLQLLSLTLVGTELDVIPRAGGRSSLEQMTDITRRFQAQTSKLWGAMSVGELALETSKLVWRDDKGAPLLSLPIDRMEFWAEDDQIQLSLRGRVGAEAYSMGGTLQGIQAFQDGQTASLDMTGALGSTFIILSGEVSGDRDGDSELLLQVLGPNVSGLAGVFGYRDRVVPAPFALSVLLDGNLLGRLAGEIDGKFDASEFSGTLLSNYSSGPAINLKMNGSYVNLEVFEPFLIAPFDAASQEENAFAKTDFIGQLDLSFLSVTARDIDLGPGRFVVTSGPEKVSWKIEQGSAKKGALAIDIQQSRKGPESLTIKAQAEGFDFGSALSVFSDDFDAVGIASLSTNLSSNGELSGPPLSNLSGSIEMIVAAERIASFRTGLVPRDLERVLGEDLIAGSVMRDACLVTQGSMRNGRLTANSFALETENVITTGGGTIDFRGDTVNMSLRPRPKDPRQMKDAVDIVVGGRLSTPKIRTNDRGLSRGLSGSLSLNGLLSEGEGLIKSLAERPGGGPCFNGLLGY